MLVHVSAGYLPVRGWLHTCYSPVRRSPAVEGKPSTPLPLDLHVLSLSLAFILSQDQTLRCCILFFFISKVVRIASAIQTEGFQLIVLPCPEGTDKTAVTTDFPTRLLP